MESANLNKSFDYILSIINEKDWLLTILPTCHYHHQYLLLHKMIITCNMNCHNKNFFFSTDVAKVVKIHFESVINFKNIFYDIIVVLIFHIYHVYSCFPFFTNIYWVLFILYCGFINILGILI